jgi:hypothetical protein
MGKKGCIGTVAHALFESFIEDDHRVDIQGAAKFCLTALSVFVEAACRPAKAAPKGAERKKVVPPYPEAL